MLLHRQDYLFGDSHLYGFAIGGVLEMGHPYATPERNFFRSPLHKK
jgi:hypothetical protein